MKLAVAEGRTYGAETKKKDTAAVERLRTRDRFERPSRKDAAGSRLADRAVKTTRHPYSRESDAYQTGGSKGKC